MREYEVMIVISPQVTDEGVPGVVAQVNQLIAAQGGVVETTLTNPPWGHRRLAYPIQDFRDAYYAVLHVQLEPLRIEPLERDLKLLNDVIRYLVVRRDQAIKAEAKAASRRPVAERPDAEAGGSDEDGVERT